MSIDDFIKEVNKLGISPSPSQLAQLEKYFELLVEWNEKINLTRIIEKNDVYLKHFYDSLTICKEIDLSSIANLCDIGTGAGFPGLVLKIMFPTLHVTLVDSLLKRVNFLKLVINELCLENISVLHMRGEDYARENREKFDVVTTRAVASLEIISEICLPLVKVNGYFIPLKGNADEELQKAQNILKEMDAKILSINKFLLPIENSNRTLIKIKKEKETSKKFPRNFDKIKKRH